MSSGSTFTPTPVTTDELKAMEGEFSSFRSSMKAMASTVQSLMGMSSGPVNMSFDDDQQQ